MNSLSSVRVLSTLILFLLTSPLRAQAQSTYLAVGEAKTKIPVIALMKSDTSVSNTIESDLNFTGLFKMLPATGFPQPKVSSLAEVKFADWLKAGADYLGFSSLKVEGGKLSFEFHLIAIGTHKELLAKRYSSEVGESKVMAHSVANDIYFAITGKKGIFLTKITFACDKTGKKEIFTMNFDGSDVRQITKLRSIAMGPAWSPDGTKIAFSIFNKHSDNQKNLDLFEFNFKTGNFKPLSNRKGINSGAAYSPSGNKIAFTMSYTGNPEIHLLDVSTKETTQFTKSLGFDVDPNFSPDGSKLAFVSSRAGKPMLYVSDIAHPETAQRLTYAGQFNATPSWAPDGSKIVFAGWLDKHFDIFTITPDGAKIDRLTKNEGNNEDPYFSPDGNFIVFSSNRSSGKNIYLMNSDATNVKRLTFGIGNCVAPKWSPYLN